MNKETKQEIPLNVLQRWMQSVIEHPGTNDDAWKSEHAQRELPFDDAYANVLPSKTLSPVERIAIYRRMFFLRMTESMAIDYPGVKHVLGEKEFDRIVTEEYVKKYPSNSYTLNHLGRYFPQFILASDIKHKEFLYDLARLELSITNTMDADESPLLKQQAIAAVPQDKWETAKLIPVSAFEVMTFEFNVCAYLNAVMEEPGSSAIKKEKTFAVIFRSNYQIFWEEISEQQFVLLHELVSGKTFGESFATLTERFSGQQEDLERNLFEWFNEWVSSGYFSKIEF